MYRCNLVSFRPTGDFVISSQLWMKLPAANTISSIISSLFSPPFSHHFSTVFLPEGWKRSADWEIFKRHVFPAAHFFIIYSDIGVTMTLLIVSDIHNHSTDCRLVLLVGPRGSAVERQSLASVLSPSCARPVADGWPLNVGKPSARGQPTRPTQPFILSGSMNE